MHSTKFFVAVTDFTLTESRPPRMHAGQVVGLRWRFTDVELADLVKYVPTTGYLTVFRAGKIVAQRSVTDLAMRSFLRAGWVQRT